MSEGHQDDSAELPGSVEVHDWEGELQAISARLAKESRRSALWGFLGGLVVMGGLVLTVYGYHQASQLLVKRNNQVVQLNKVVTLKTDEAVKSKQQTDEAKSALTSTVDALQSQSPAVASTTKSVVEKVLDANPIVARVYIHLYSSDQKPLGNQIAAVLRANGYIVPGIDVMNLRFKRTEVHYYNPPTSESVADANAIARVVATKVDPVAALAVNPAKTDHLRPRAYGLWLAADLR